MRQIHYNANYIYNSQSAINTKYYSSNAVLLHSRTRFSPLCMQEESPTQNKEFDQ